MARLYALLRLSPLVFQYCMRSPGTGHTVNHGTGWSGRRTDIEARNAHPVWFQRQATAHQRLQTSHRTTRNIAAHQVWVPLLQCSRIPDLFIHDRGAKTRGEPVQLPGKSSGHIHTVRGRWSTPIGHMRIGPQHMVTLWRTGRISDLPLGNHDKRSIGNTPCIDLGFSQPNLSITTADT